jgi:hypothetical protein
MQRTATGKLAVITGASNGIGRALTKLFLAAIMSIGIGIGIGIGTACAARADAQAPGPLPTAPGADRAVSGGLSQAHASLPGGPGLSPLEPYLILWLLPASGLVTVAAGVYADRRTQRRQVAKSAPSRVSGNRR